MQTLLKQANWQEALLDAPQPMTKEERISHRKADMLGTGLGAALGAGLGALHSKKTRGNVDLLAMGAMGGAGMGLGHLVGSTVGGRNILKAREENPLDEGLQKREEDMKSSRFNTDVVGETVQGAKIKPSIEYGTR